MKHLHQLHFTSLLVLPSPCFSAIPSCIFKRRFSSSEMEETDILLLVPPALSPLVFANRVSRNEAGLQHLCPRQCKAGRHQPSAHRQWWMSQPHVKSRTILQIACSEVLLQLRFCTGNIETCLFSSFLLESS